VGFTGVAGYFLLNTYGMSLTSGVNASIISATLPLFTLMLAALYLKERISLSQWTGLLLGIAGVLIITVHSQANQQQSLWGYDHSWGDVGGKEEAWKPCRSCFYRVSSLLSRRDRS
jgi:drug/metabolite transporter (DMT)-like permease